VRGLQEPALFDLAGMALRGAKRDLRRAGLDFVFVDCPPGVATIHDDAIAAANTAAWTTQLRDLGQSDDEITRSFRSFNAWAWQFRQASDEAEKS